MFGKDSKTRKGAAGNSAAADNAILGGFAAGKGTGAGACDVCDPGQSAVVVQDAAAVCAGRRVLVVGRGSAAKQTVRACFASNAAQVFVTGFSAKPHEAERLYGAQLVALGAKESAQLWRNDYALIQAATACAADVLLFAAGAMEPADGLLRAARANGWSVYRPLDSDKLRQSWVEASAPANAALWQPRWRSCPKCKLVHDASTLAADADCCPECGSLYRLSAQERIEATFDMGTWVDWSDSLDEPDPLGFPSYGQTLERNRRRSGVDEAVHSGMARLYGLPVAVCIMESSFMMGSMGYVVGERITRCVERATKERLPLVIFTASGGARMQEGLVSLMQMAKTSAALRLHAQAKLPYISVITDPTTGGVTASFAMLGDIIAAEPGALIGFAGRRVIQDTIKQTLPDDFQTAQFALEHGLIDAVVPRSSMRAFLAQSVRLLMANTKGGAAYLASASGSVLGDASAAVAPDDAYVSKHLRKARGKHGFGVLGHLFGDERVARALRKRGVADFPGIKAVGAGAAGSARSAAWDNVQLARNVQRPTSCFYIDEVFDGFIELHGDREFGDDGAIVGGIAWFEGHAVTVIAQEKGVNLEQRIARNFGCPHPEGYRKAMRLMQQADKFGMPVICLIDTQGAYCGKEAEERGVGGAIANSMQLMSGLGVPVVSVVLGEAGSGGALALGVANIVGMQEHSVYSVLSPEGFASILFKDGSRAPEAADVMKMCAPDALELGVVDAVICEGDGPAHLNRNQAAGHVRDFLRDSLAGLAGLDADALRQQRYERFRAF